MFATSARYNPCFARCGLASLGRSKVSVPSSCFNLIAGSTDCSKVPLGPFTVTRFLSLIEISTPFGMVIGAFPMRDIFVTCLAHVAQYLATHVQCPGLLIGDHAFARGDDGHAQAVEYAGKFLRVGIF